MKVKAFAKINLFLDITGTDGRGYHLIDSVMQSVSLCDDITVAKTVGGGISITCNKSDIPCDERNIAYKAANAFFEACGIADRNVNIDIFKRIPHEAGLGGGSADAAAVLAALNTIYKTELNDNELCKIGLKVGADVPFCVCGGTKRARGVGEKLSPLDAVKNMFIVIVKPNFSVSTKKAYFDYDGLESAEHGDINKTLIAVKNGGAEEISASLFNAFEQIVGDRELQAVKSEMFSNGAMGSMMSGSGSAVFGIFIDRSVAENCVNRMKEKYPQTFLCEPCEAGFMFEEE